MHRSMFTPGLWERSAASHRQQSATRAPWVRIRSVARGVLAEAIETHQSGGQRSWCIGLVSAASGRGVHAGCAWLSRADPHARPALWAEYEVPRALPQLGWCLRGQRAEGSSAVRLPGPNFRHGEARDEQPAPLTRTSLGSDGLGMSSHRGMSEIRIRLIVMKATCRLGDCHALSDDHAGSAGRERGLAPVDIRCATMNTPTAVQILICAIPNSLHIGEWLIS